MNERRLESSENIYNRTATPLSSAPSKPHPPASPFVKPAAEAGELELGGGALELGSMSEAVVGLPAMTELTLSMFLLVVPALRLALLAEGAEVMRVDVRVLLLEMMVVVRVVEVREIFAGAVTEGVVVGMEVALAGETLAVSCCSIERRTKVSSAGERQALLQL